MTTTTPDVFTQKFHPITTVGERLPGKPHQNSVKRWIDHGINGVRLQSVRVGNRRFVSEDALAEFITALSGDK